MKVTDLVGPARRLYDSWREVGRTETQALEEVRRSGIVEEQRRAAAGASPAGAGPRDIDVLIAEAFSRPAPSTASVPPAAAPAPVVAEVSEVDADAALASAFGRRTEDAAMTVTEAWGVVMQGGHFDAQNRPKVIASRLQEARTVLSEAQAAHDVQEGKR